MKGPGTMTGIRTLAVLFSKMNPRGSRPWKNNETKGVNRMVSTRNILPSGINLLIN